MAGISRNHVAGIASIESLGNRHFQDWERGLGVMGLAGADQDVRQWFEGGQDARASCQFSARRVSTVSAFFVRAERQLTTPGADRKARCGDTGFS